MAGLSDAMYGGHVGVSTTPLVVVVFGATGDLAKRKLFPALFQLMHNCPDAPLLPVSTRIVGFGRSAMELDAFLAKQCVHVAGPRRDDFLKQISYFQGKYDNEEDFARLHRTLLDLEGHVTHGNRIFFLSLPSSVFGSVCEHINSQARAIGGFTRLIMEKPFGKDSRTYAELDGTTSRLFREDQLFRIDHYLAKEQVLNLVAFRFANQLYEPLWNRHHIEQVQIIFKEDLGTSGRGGYFDEFGIIRDMMQNHLLQVFLWLAMEPPNDLTAEHIASAKCELLEKIATIDMEECFLGQFTANSWTVDGQERVEQGYLDDTTVPSGSKCPTYASVVLNVDNERWRGVPFLMSAGKGLDERLTEVRITFKKQSYNALLPSQPNELVLRIQPDEAIYFNCTNKCPGWSQNNVAPVRLGMSYSDSFPEGYVAGAYERMLLNTAKGDLSLFVGRQELVEAWRIFTPLLDEIDSMQPQPVLYPFGSRAPPGFEEFALEHGVNLGAFLLDPTLVAVEPRRPRHGSVAWQKSAVTAPDIRRGSVAWQPVTPEIRPLWAVTPERMERAVVELPDSGSKSSKIKQTHEETSADKLKLNLKQVPLLDDLKVSETPTPLRRRLQYHATM